MPAQNGSKATALLKKSAKSAKKAVPKVRSDIRVPVLHGSVLIRQLQKRACLEGPPRGRPWNRSPVVGAQKVVKQAKQAKQAVSSGARKTVRERAGWWGKARASLSTFLPYKYNPELCNCVHGST